MHGVFITICVRVQTVMLTTVMLTMTDGSRAGLNEDLSEIENLSGRHFDPSITNYPKLSRTLTDDTNATSFTLHVEAGVFHEREVIWSVMRA